MINYNGICSINNNILVGVVLSSVIVLIIIMGLIILWIKFKKSQIWFINPNEITFDNSYENSIIGQGYNSIVVKGTFRSMKVAIRLSANNLLTVPNNSCCLVSLANRACAWRDAQAHHWRPRQIGQHRPHE